MTAPGTAERSPSTETGIDPVREGLLLGGRYKIGRQLGVGGMGIVFAAHDLTAGQPVALKFLRPQVEKTDVERFLREARAAECLRNVHVTRVFDVGELDSGLPFIVMEYLEGKTLAERADEASPMSVAEIVGWVLQACEGLADAHARGIIHRDLKPANLFLTHGEGGAPLVKVLDFGVSKFIDGGPESDLTTTGNVVGSPSFASPEQLDAPRTVGPATDLWAVGVTLYFLLGKELPFQGKSRVHACMLVLTSTPVPLHELRPDLPRGLSDAVMRCLEKDPAARPANVAELARSLEPFVPAAFGRGVAERIAAILDDPTMAVIHPLTSLESSGTSSATRARAAGDAQAAAPGTPPAARRLARARASLAVFALLAALVVVFAFMPARHEAGVSRPEPAPVAAETPGEKTPGEKTPPATPANAESAAVAVPPATSTTTPGSTPKTRRAAPRDSRRDPRSYR